MLFYIIISHDCNIIYIPLSHTVNPIILSRKRAEIINSTKFSYGYIIVFSQSNRIKGAAMNIFLAVICATIIGNRQLLFSKYNHGWRRVKFYSQRNPTTAFINSLPGIAILSRRKGYLERGETISRRRVEEDAKAARAIERCRVVPAGARVNNGLHSLLRAHREEKFIGVSGPCTVKTLRTKVQKAGGGDGFGILCR